MGKLTITTYTRLDGEPSNGAGEITTIMVFQDKPWGGEPSRLFLGIDPDQLLEADYDGDRSGPDGYTGRVTQPDVSLTNVVLNYDKQSSRLVLNGVTYEPATSVDLVSNPNMTVVRLLGVEIDGVTVYFLDAKDELNDKHHAFYRGRPLRVLGGVGVRGTQDDDSVGQNGLLGRGTYFDADTMEEIVVEVRTTNPEDHLDTSVQTTTVNGHRATVLDPRDYTATFGASLGSAKVTAK